MMWSCGVCVYLCVCLCAGVRLHRVRPPLLAPRVGSSTRRKWQVASWRPLFPPIFFQLFVWAWGVPVTAACPGAICAVRVFVLGGLGASLGLRALLCLRLLPFCYGIEMYSGYNSWAVPLPREGGGVRTPHPWGFVC